MLPAKAETGQGTGRDRLGSLCRDTGKCWGRDAQSVLRGSLEEGVRSRAGMGRTLERCDAMVGLAKETPRK